MTMRQTFLRALDRVYTALLLLVFIAYCLSPFMILLYYVFNGVPNEDWQAGQ